jgi:hypothetical protein
LEPGCVPYHTLTVLYTALETIPAKKQLPIKTKFSGYVLEKPFVTIQNSDDPVLESGKLKVYSDE